jgi:hypothetical protein
MIAQWSNINWYGTTHWSNMERFFPPADSNPKSKSIFITEFALVIKMQL